MRRDVSFLLAEGHAHAGHYPLWQLQLETELAYQRVNKTLATEAVLTKSAIDAALSEKALKHFEKTLAQLNPELK